MTTNTKDEGPKPDVLKPHEAPKTADATSHAAAKAPAKTGAEFFSAKQPDDISYTIISKDPNGLAAGQKLNANSYEVAIGTFFELCPDHEILGIVDDSTEVNSKDYMTLDITLLVKPTPQAKAA